MGRGVPGLAVGYRRTKTTLLVTLLFRAEALNAFGPSRLISDIGDASSGIRANALTERAVVIPERLGITDARDRNACSAGCEQKRREQNEEAES